SSGILSSVTSSAISVGPGPARKLVILTQPPSAATASQTFASAAAVGVQDQYGNLRANDNSTVVSAARSVGTGTLQGLTTVTVSGGVATFTNLSYSIAETMSVVFTSSGATNAVSSNVTVGAGAFAKLLLLAPGEAAAPGTATGKTGTPANQLPDTL